MSLVYPLELFLCVCSAISFFLNFSMDHNGRCLKRNCLANHPNANSSAEDHKPRKKKKLCEEIRQALIKEIMELANELPPEAPQHLGNPRSIPKWWDRLEATARLTSRSLYSRVKQPIPQETSRNQPLSWRMGFFFLIFFFSSMSLHEQGAREPSGQWWCQNGKQVLQIGSNH